MTKAERRKRARARAREREQAQVAPDALEKAVEAVQAAPDPAPVAETQQAETESEFITEPIVARERRPPAAVAQRAQPVADRRRAVAVDEDEDEDEDDEDDDDLITGDGDDDDDDDGDEDDDEELDGQEDALFEVACAAVEQGDDLSWQELVGLLLTAEVTDPRLALLVGLIMEGSPEGETPVKHTPLPLTGKRVLDMLKEIELGEIAEEAREVTALSPGDPDDTEDERELVRTNARQLNELSKRELSKGSRGQTGERDRGRPLRASDVRARRTALSTGAMSTRSRG